MRLAPGGARCLEQGESPKTGRGREGDPPQAPRQSQDLQGKAPTWAEPYHSMSLGYSFNKTPFRAVVARPALRSQDGIGQSIEGRQCPWPQWRGGGSWAWGGNPAPEARWRRGGSWIQLSLQVPISIQP